MNGLQVSADETYSRAGVQFNGDRTQFLVLATTVPLGWEGRLGDTNGSRLILKFALIIDCIRVSNSTSLALGREGSLRYCVCVRLPTAMEVFSKSDNTMSVMAYFHL